MNLKGLVHREIGEGLTSEELASVIGVSSGRSPTFWWTNLRKTRQSGKNLRCISAQTLNYCNQVARHTQRVCSTEQRVPIPPPSAR